MKTGPKTIGLIGAGIMGHGVGANLLEAGHDLCVVAHRQRVNIDALVSKGAVEVPSIADLAHQSDAIILCVTDTAAALSVVDALAQDMRPGTLVIDMTTNAPDGPAILAERLATGGARYVEAPLTGGAQQAAEGTVGAIVGCDEGDFADAKAILEGCCARIEWFGDIGMAAKTKLISNFLALGTATLVIESFRQAREFGVDWQKLYDLALLGSGNSTGLQRIIGNALSGRFDGYVFTVSNTLKDLGYVSDLLPDGTAAGQIAEVLRDTHRDAVNAGHAQRLISELLDPSLS